MLNAGKMELMKSKASNREQHLPADEGQPDLPRNVEDADRINLGNVVTASGVKLFPKLLRSYETEIAQKMRKINTTQAKSIY